MFIQSLAQVSLEQSKNSGVNYNDLAQIVDTIDTLQFLQGNFNKKRFSSFLCLYGVELHFCFITFLGLLM